MYIEFSIHLPAQRGHLATFYYKKMKLLVDKYKSNAVHYLTAQLATLVFVILWILNSATYNEN